MRPIALQLYSVRDELARNFEQTMRQIAAMGYAGVETAGFPGTTAKAAARLFQELGLTVCGAHAPLPLGEDKDQVLDDLSHLACKRLISAYLPPEQYQTLDTIKEACDRLNEANAVAAENGLTFGVHNHWWEFQPVEGHYPYRLWLERLDPAIFFELDLYWVQTAGLDPAQTVAEFGDRIQLLHLKDGPLTTDEPMQALGQGQADFLTAIEAGQGSTEWLVVELDRCATDMMVALEQSYQFLVKQGVGHGSRR